MFGEQNYCLHHLWYKHILHPPPLSPFLNLLPNFQKGGLNRISEESYWERVGWLFSEGRWGVGWVQFLHKNKLKLEIFNDEKSL